MSGDDRFDAAYVAHYWAIVRYLARRRGNDHARDLASEVFIVAWRRRSALPSNPLPWLYGIARNVLANANRQEQRQQRLLDRLTTAVDRRAETAPVLLAEDESPWLSRSLQGLSPSDREVLQLSAWEELSLDDLAAALSCSRAAAAMRLHRARERFRAVLDSDPSVSAILRRSR